MNDAWYYRIGENSLGPLSAEQLKMLIHTGQVGQAAPVWREGLASWMTASQVPELMPSENGLQYILPTSRTSGTALAAGYLGIFGIFIPFLAPLAIVLGVLGCRDLKRHPEKNGWGRAITGIVLGSLWILAFVAFCIVVAIESKH